MPPPPPPERSGLMQVQLAQIKFHPTNAYRSEEIRLSHINIWQHYMCPLDAQHYELGPGTEGASFEYEPLASHAVLLESKQKSKELLAICQTGLLHKFEDLARKIDGTKNSEDRLSFQYRQGRAEMGLLNGQKRSFWQMAQGNLKLAQLDEGVVRYDGFKIYINNTPHEGNETDYVKKCIVFREVEDKSREKLKSRKGRRSQILTPKSGDSGDDCSIDSSTDSSIDSGMEEQKQKKKRGRVSEKEKEEVSSADSSIDPKEKKLEDILHSLSIDQQKQFVISFIGANGFDSLK
jgi:hypothetical protein